MDISLPPIIKTYFQAKNDHDDDAALACFAEDAIVYDEGHEYKGMSAIQGWLEETTGKFKLTIVPKSVSEEHTHTVVIAEVSGSFPGSPLMFKYDFTFENDKIMTISGSVAKNVA